MKSWEVLKMAADNIGVKALAGKLNLSSALIYKWCQESPRDDPDASGARNPLDRLAEIVEATEEPAVVSWLCHEADGFFVRNPKPHGGHNETELLKSTQQLVQEFSELLSTVTSSIEDDGQIESKEADLIRRKWEMLKSNAESFVLACETGCYIDEQAALIHPTTHDHELVMEEDKAAKKAAKAQAKATKKTAKAEALAAQQATQTDVETTDAAERSAAAAEKQLSIRRWQLWVSAVGVGAAILTAAVALMN